MGISSAIMLILLQTLCLIVISTQGSETPTELPQEVSSEQYELTDIDEEHSNTTERKNERKIRQVHGIPPVLPLPRPIRPPTLPRGQRYTRPVRQPLGGARFPGIYPGGDIFGIHPSFNGLFMQPSRPVRSNHLQIAHGFPRPPVALALTADAPKSVPPFPSITSKPLQFPELDQHGKFPGSDFQDAMSFTNPETFFHNGKHYKYTTRWVYPNQETSESTQQSLWQSPHAVHPLSENALGKPTWSQPFTEKPNATTSDLKHGSTVQFLPSITTSEYHEVYQDNKVLGSEPVIKLIEAPVLGKDLKTSNSVDEGKKDARRKATLKEILAEDCPDAELRGYCASPPRYPAQQITKALKQCDQVLSSMYAPIPESDEEIITKAAERSDDFLDNQQVSEMERGNRQTWSWSRYAKEDPSVLPQDPASKLLCDTEKIRMEPGYARDMHTGRWFVVVQSRGLMTQYVHIDTCIGEGRPCPGLSAFKCNSRGNAGSRGPAKSSYCEQKYSYQHLISWDPDSPELCPRIRVFRFPSACVCRVGL